MNQQDWYCQGDKAEEEAEGVPGVGHGPGVLPQDQPAEAGDEEVVAEELVEETEPGTGQMRQKRLSFRWNKTLR